MRFKRFLECMLFLMLVCGICRAADVRVTPLSDQEAEFFMQNISSFRINGDINEDTQIAFFENNDVLVKEQKIKTTTKITFESPSEEGIDDIAADSRISISPNPSVDVIHIIGLENPQQVQLYNLKGQLVLTTMDANVNVSPLSTGTYIMRVGKQCFKVIIE